jgi:SRSO17 transposase
MPKEIVIETCPAPECNLSEQDIQAYVEELASYIELFRPGFARSEQMAWSQVYVRGLLGTSARKNIEGMALEQGVKVRSLQHFMGQSPWASEPMLAIHQTINWSNAGRKGWGGVD